MTGAVGSNSIARLCGERRTRVPKVCFVGLGNLGVLAPEYGRLQVGGGSLQQTLLARALVRLGYSVSMIVEDHGQPDGAIWDHITTYAAYAVAAGVPVVRFLHPRWTGLVSAVRRADADVYYTSAGGAHVGQLAAYLGPRGRRFVFRIGSDGDCLRDDKVRIRYWRDRRLYEYGLRHANAILVQTRTQQESLERNFHLPSTVASSLVDTPDRIHTLAERDVPVLWVGNIRPLKRPDLVVELARLMPDVSVHMVGGRMPGHETSFRQLSDAASAVPNVRFHGQLPYRSTNELSGRARVLLNTSDVEGFPNTYLQAWVRGTPVVGFFDPDGLIEREGLGRRVDSTADMRTAVEQLLSDPVAWQEASLRCRRYMLEHHSDDRLLEPYLAALDLEP